jgi:uncharacterized protein (TIGR02266 family)
LKGRTILIADDSDVFRIKCGNILTDAGFKTILVKDGHEVMEQLASNASNVDMLILDLQMPHVDGFKVLQWMRDNNLEGTLPVLAITDGYDFSEVIMKLKHLGAAGLATKSTSSEHLVYRVNALLFNENETKRFAKRIPTTIPVDFTKEGITSSGFISNISETGLFINYTNESLKSGDIIHLTFSLPDYQEVIEVEGKVVWLDKFDGSSENILKGFGIHFTKIKPDDKKGIATFVKRELEMLNSR